LPSIYVSATRLTRARGAGTGGATGLGVEPNFVMSTLVGAAPVRPAHPYRPMPRAPSQEGRDYGRRR